MYTCHLACCMHASSLPAIYVPCGHACMCLCACVCVCTFVYVCTPLQLVLRSFNNLNERFHHSFFLYLLTDTQHFVTVENYIVTLVLLILVLILKVRLRYNRVRTPKGQAGHGHTGARLCMLTSTEGCRQETQTKARIVCWSHVVCVCRLPSA